MKKNYVLGPSFEEMLHPEKIDPKIRKKALEMKDKDPLDPINLYNIFILSLFFKRNVIFK